MAKTMQQHVMQVLNTPLDRRLISQMEKAGTTLDYLSGPAVHHLMDEAFGPIYSETYSEPWITEYESITDKKGEYVPKKVLEIKCTISVPIFSDLLQQTVKVEREGFGSCVMKRQFEEMMLKTAQTDAFKKAASSFGIDAELRIKKNPDEYEYFMENVYGIWTQGLMKRYMNELSEIRSFMAKSGISNQDEIAVRTIGEGRLTPKNITRVIERLRLGKTEAVA